MVTLQRGGDRGGGSPPGDLAVGGVLLVAQLVRQRRDRVAVQLSEPGGELVRLHGDLLPGEIGLSHSPLSETMQMAYPVPSRKWWMVGVKADTPGAPASVGDDGERDVDVVARRVRVRAHPVRRFD